MERGKKYFVNPILWDTRGTTIPGPPALSMTWPPIHQSIYPFIRPLAALQFEAMYLAHCCLALKNFQIPNKMRWHFNRYELLARDQLTKNKKFIFIL